MGETHLKHMLDYQNNKLMATSSDLLMGCHRLYGYGYRVAQDADKKVLTDRLGEPYLKENSDGSYTIVQPSHSCVHNVPKGSWCHAQDMITTDNLWSMIYPPTEVMQDANLVKEPVAYDFTNIIANKNNYRDE